MTKTPLLISACLLGVPCRYDGASKPCAALEQLADRFVLVPVCPEQLGGLSTPRVPAERNGDRVITREGKDVTLNYCSGAQEALRIAHITGCRTALLKAKSPSCGYGRIYDGTHTGTLTKGNGITAQLLKDHGITVFTDEQLDALFAAEQINIPE